eukprot:TRINITY_DN31044_c0_g1_i1.p1 TRINITY_DN31044_c0_g1~~TRINITY_DN31044_c0_g1_i1.p1  ORF type:complete len:468 (-),score=115.33 TRINITY_DN31044_c0_g1_i1:22-1425(-)
MASAESSCPPDEQAWREAWVGSPFSGKVVLRESSAGQEVLAIDCPGVAKKYGKDAEILDDGRTVGVSLGDSVAFGVVLRTARSTAPIAVNVWRITSARTPSKPSRGPAAQAKEPAVSESSAREEARKASKAALPAALRGTLTGVIGNQSVNGDFFIRCPEVFEVFNSDTKIRKKDMPEGLGVGDSVSFEVLPPRQSTGSGNGMPLPPTGVQVRFTARRATGKGSRKGGKAGPAMRMLGIVEKPSKKTGRHHVFCQDISDAYGRDAQIPDEEFEAVEGLKPGDRISFDAQEPREFSRAPIFARNIVIVSKRGEKRRRNVRDGDGEEEADEDLQLEEDEALDNGDEEEEEAITLEAADALEDDAVAASVAAKDEAAEDTLPPDEAEAQAAPETAEADMDEDEEDPLAPLDLDALDEPSTTEGWVKAQARIFGGLPPLKDGWIRIRSKTTRLVYYYNTRTGASSPDEPRR